MKAKKLLAFALVICMLFTGCGTSSQNASTAASVQQTEDVTTPTDTVGTAENLQVTPAESAAPVVSDAPTEQPADVQVDAASAAEVPETQEAEPEAKIWPSDAEGYLAEMTIEEKVAQLFYITPEALTGVGTATMAGDTTKAAFDQTPVGGIIYFAQNLENEEQVKNMLYNMQEISKDRIGLPVFTGVDEEGGTVTRISGTGKFDVPDIPDMSEVGAAGDTAAAYNIGLEIGEYLYRMGFNMDFAPDADVLTNPENTVVQQRSFGSDPTLVSDMALAVANGLSAYGIIPCAKHFPGHGATAGDTHDGYAYTDKSREELLSQELLPFYNWINENAGVIMVGHISLPNVTSDGLPASLSYEVITGLLREEMGYDGVVITDGLNMSAIAEVYTSAEAAVTAINAGADMLLCPDNFQDAYQGVLAAVQDGTISEDRINESVRRIINLKLSMHSL